MNIIAQPPADMTLEIIDFNALDAWKKFVESMRRTGFAVLKLRNGQKGIHKGQLQLAFKENEAFFKAPFEQKLPSLFFNDDHKDAGWFPMGSEGETGGVPNLLEYTHHRPDMRKINFKGFDFTQTYNVFKGAARLNQILSTWLVMGMPREHSQWEHMNYLLTQIDTDRRSLVRCIRYYPEHPFKPGLKPTLDESGKFYIWNDQHEDADWLTIILAQSIPGLQLLASNGVWHMLPSADDLREDEILAVVNGGDTLSAASGGILGLCQTLRDPTTNKVISKVHDPMTFDGWHDAHKALHMWRDRDYYTDRKLRLISEGFYPSTTHRVVMKLDNAQERYSLPCFFHINGWEEIQGHWIARDKMRSYVRNKEAQRIPAMKAIYEIHGQEVPAYLMPAH